jgi:type IV secretion system protein VirB11
MSPIQMQLDNPNVTDIVANRPERVAVRTSGLWRWFDVPSFDFNTMDAVSILAGQRNGREFDEANPYVNCTLPGGQRFQGVRPPGTKDGRVLWGIRRPPAKARTVDDDDFDDLFDETNTRGSRRLRARTELGQFYKNREWKSLFVAGRMAGLNMAMVGSMGSGKSDFSRRMIQVYRPETRIVTVETDDEYGDAGPENTASVLYDDSQMTCDAAIRVCKRLVPSEIFLQEVRGAEAWTLLGVMGSGHGGCTSWHGEEGREEEALADMARMHDSAKNMDNGRMLEKIRAAFDVIAYFERDTNRFKVTSVRLMAAEQEAAV